MPIHPRPKASNLRPLRHASARRVTQTAKHAMPTSSMAAHTSGEIHGMTRGQPSASVRPGAASAGK